VVCVCLCVCVCGCVCVVGGCVCVCVCGWVCVVCMCGCVWCVWVCVGVCVCCVCGVCGCVCVCVLVSLLHDVYTHTTSNYNTPCSKVSRTIWCINNDLLIISFCLHFPVNIYHISHSSTDEFISPFKRLLTSLRTPFSSALYRVLCKKVVMIYQQMPELSQHSTKSSWNTLDFPLSQCMIHQFSFRCPSGPRQCRRHQGKPSSKGSAVRDGRQSQGTDTRYKK